MTLQLSSLNLLQLKILRKLTAANLHLTTLALLRPETLTVLFPGPSELSLGLKNLLRVSSLHALTQFS